MVKNKTLFTVAGFLLAGIGFWALILSIVGVKLAFLTWIDIPGSLFGFVVRILFIIVGIALVVIAQNEEE